MLLGDMAGSTGAAPKGGSETGGREQTKPRPDVRLYFVEIAAIAPVLPAPHIGAVNASWAERRLP